MKHLMRIQWLMQLITSLTLVLLLSVFAVAGEKSKLGKEDKFRVLVDKVLSYSTRPMMTEAHVKEIKDAGFNVVVPRWGAEDMNIVRNVATLAQKEGVFFMPWIRGSGYTDEENRKMVWADGTVQTKLYSPNDDEFWEKMTNILLGHARISTEVPSLIGTFVDFENYDKEGSRGQCYSLSYDEKILKEFAAYRKIEIPALDTKERYPWLVKENLLDAFATFQIESWRTRCRKLRQQIDAINPDFKLVVYPAPGTLFMIEAVYREWATERTPLVLADASTYAKPLPFLPEKESLFANRSKILEHVAFVRKYNFPFMYIGGIDPILEPNDPEFCGKNADMLADVTNGYWVFYEGPTYGQPNHEAFFKWFARANESIATGKFSLQHEKRQMPEVLSGTKIERRSDRPIIAKEGISITTHEDMVGYGKFQVEWLDGISKEYLKQADIIVFQSATRWFPASDGIRQNLRSYVEEGGSIFITHIGWNKRGCIHEKNYSMDEMPLMLHDTSVESIFPEVATWSVSKPVVSTGRPISDNTLIVFQSHQALGDLKQGTQFTTDSSNYMILKAGPKGQVIIRNTAGEPVYIVGTYGKGRVAFSGCFYGYSSSSHSYNFSGLERQVFFSILEWLASKTR